MFICQIIASRGNGGLEKHVRDLSISLVEKGHRVIVIGDPEFTKTLPSMVEKYSINMRLSRYNPWLLLQLFIKLRKHHFDIIHAQANKATSILAVLKIFLKIPSVATLHNIKSQFKIYDCFGHVITVSRYLASKVHATSVNVIYNGINEPSNQKYDLKKMFNLPENKPVICAVGRLVSAKGFDLLLEAVDGLDISLVIAGDGPERSVLEKRVKRMHSNTHCLLIGHHDNTPAIMRSSDAVVISSRREGFSYVLNEALLCEVNILSTDVPVANEILPKELIVNVNDINMLRERLVELLQKRGLWTEMMKYPQQFSRQQMTVSLMTDKTLAVYNSILR